MKTKILLALALVAAVFFTIPAFAQDTNSAAAIATAPQLTPEAVASINNLMCLLPASCWPAVALALGLIIKFGVIGRLVVGWSRGGIGGVIGGLFTGTNAPNNSSNVAPPNYGTPRNPVRGVGLLLCLLLPCFMLVGCANDGVHHQLVQNESGTGMKAKIPVGYNGNNIFELDLTVGTFKATTMLQPVETNRVYTPTLVVAATTRGNTTMNAMNTSSNQPTAVVQGGDAYVITTGHAAASETNDTDITIQAWQDAPPSQSK
jgi:hypothetical protein